jgi:ParB/RepB/Spo0J family partition protein
MQVALERIDADPTNIRRTAVDRADDEFLQANMDTLGQIHEIVVRKGENGRFVLVAGARRVKAARALGWSEIRADVVEIDDGVAKAVQVAENTQRAGVHPVDRWQAMVQLVRSGVAPDLAAQCLSITPREAAMYEKLGKLAPAMIDAIRQYGIPPSHGLAIISRAPVKAQEQALRRKDIRKPNGISWMLVAQACEVRSFGRGSAIFDWEKVKNVRWEEDMFAEPGDPRQFLTTDCDAFLAAQTEALRDRVAKRQKKGDRIEIVLYDPKIGGLKIPAGFEHLWETPRSAKLPESDPRRLITGVDTGNGSIIEVWIKKKGAKLPVSGSKKADFAEKADSHEDTPDTDTGTIPSDLADPQVEPAKRGLTRAGRNMVAQAKTNAIRARLADAAASMSDRTLLSLLILAIAGNNITVRGSHVAKYATTRIAPFVLGTGVLKDGMFDGSFDPHFVAAELIGRLVVVTGDDPSLGSGPVADLIGYAIDAQLKFERFDTEAFLAEVPGDELKEAGAQLGLKAKGVAALRKLLAGHAEKWTPKEAQFAYRMPRDHLEWVKETAEDDAAWEGEGDDA